MNSSNTSAYASTAEDEFWMRVALSMAEQAQSQGEVPVGAVLVRDGVQVSSGWNQSICLHDPSAHAEIMALRAAGTILSNYRLPDTTLYVTLEPCLMCWGSLLHARIGRLVFGAPDPKTGAGSVFQLLHDPRHYHAITIVGGVLQAECVALIQRFFKERRLAHKQATTR